MKPFCLKLIVAACTLTISTVAVAQSEVGGSGRATPEVLLGQRTMPGATNSDASYIRIGNYKVKGSPYLYNSFYFANVFMSSAAPLQTKIAFDTYNQQVHIFSNEDPKPYATTSAEVDSFTLKADTLNFQSDITFISAKFIDSTQKLFLQKLTHGKRYGLYKVYMGDLEQIPSDLIQPDTKQFKTDIEYYYADLKTKKLVKIKPKLKFLKNEFKGAKALDYVNVEALSDATESELEKFFTNLEE